MTEPGADAPMPAAFIGHGSPMNALEHNRYTSSWRAFGQSLPRPRAILVISAHWYINATAVTAMSRPRTIHDFYGFPSELFDVQYPAPGLPDLAASIAVVQLSINAYKPLDYHVALGARLASLRERGVLILGSGNIVHNLGGMNPSFADRGFDWALRFDEQAKSQLHSAPADVLTLLEHRDYDAAVPTPDHFIPMLYFAGLAGAQEAADVEVLVEGCAYGSLSMTSYTIGSRCGPTAFDLGDTSAGLTDVPADETNM